MATKRLIDANDALEKLEKAEQEMMVVSMMGCKAVPMHGVIEFIKTRPTVDAVEVVHGRWIEKVDMVASYFAECEETFYECSVCNSANFGESPYCPNCGAKMDGDGNGN